MATASFRPAALLGLYTETPLHCGAEAGFSYVDLPVQRERHTGFPVIPASTLKGRLKDETKPTDEPGLSEEDHRAIFGGVIESKNGESTTVPGSLSFGDGFLVAFPVRSTGVPFRWVSCPLALVRTARAMGQPLSLEEPSPGTALSRAADSDLLLEEILVSPQASDLLSDDGPLSRLLALIPQPNRGFDYIRRSFLERLVIVRDDDFAELVETGTETITRIKLTALKTTTTLPKDDYPELTDEDRQGNMFVEETVPPETIFLSAVRGNPTRWAQLQRSLPPITQLGGGETIGRGVVHLTIVPSEAD